jgi:hypothetical protein
MSTVRVRMDRIRTDRVAREVHTTRRDRPTALRAARTLLRVRVRAPRAAVETAAAEAPVPAAATMEATAGATRTKRNFRLPNWQGAAPIFRGCGISGENTMAAPMELVGRYGSNSDRRESRGGELGSFASNLRVVVWLVWLTACKWLTRYNGLSREPGT